MHFPCNRAARISEAHIKGIPVLQFPSLRPHTGAEMAKVTLSFPQLSFKLSALCCLLLLQLCL